MSIAHARPVSATAPTNSLLNATPWFKLSLTVNQSFTNEVAGGLRTDLHYENPDKTRRPAIEVNPYSNIGADLKELLELAEVRSGSDWLFVSELGVMSFDSRLTLSLPGAKNPAERDNAAPCLITARLRGTVGLKNLRVDGRTVDSGKQGYIEWKKPPNEATFPRTLPVTLAITFEVPSTGFEATQNKPYQECIELSEEFFLATGTVTIVAADKADLELDLVTIEPRSNDGKTS